MRRSKRRAPHRPAPSADASAADRGASRREFNPDYSYVKKDLRRIAALTLIFLVILIGLSFVLR